jgi:predicted RND superfamily exporter protein
VALLGIYILVVAQFGSFRLPLVILTPIPLTFLGIIFGHWLFGAPFSATSMIGIIALAGIIVRNSILLVDFIRHADESRGKVQVLIDAGAIRFKPILLTAIAAMIGAVVILADPIFQGLAISLLFGLLTSTLLTVLVIPAIYRVFKTERKGALRGAFLLHAHRQNLADLRHGPAAFGLPCVERPLNRPHRGFRGRSLVHHPFQDQPFHHLARGHIGIPAHHPQHPHRGVPA